MELIRYVIKLKNGSYMKQDFDGSLERVKIMAIDNPIDADLLSEKSIADRVLNELLTGNTNLLVLYDEENPPFKVEKLHINLS